jgi:hypothetical protein
MTIRNNPTILAPLIAAEADLAGRLGESAGDMTIEC